MAVTDIEINFTPCDNEPPEGYNIVYRVVGDLDYIDAGNFMTSPTHIGVDYPDGTQFEGIVHSPCGDVVWSTVAVDTDCTCRFAYPGEDDTAGEDRNFDITGHTFSFSNGGTPNLVVISPGVVALTSELTSGPTTASGSLALNSDPTIPFSTFQLRAQHTGSAVVSVDGDSTDETLRLQGTGGIFINPYGGGLFIDPSPAYLLGVDSFSQIVEVDPGSLGGSGGSGGGMFRFAYPGEDSTAGEERLFYLGTQYRIEFIGNYDTAVHDAIFKVTNQADNGQAIYGVGVGTAGAVRGDSDGGYAGQFISTDGVGSLSSSVNALGAMISSVNEVGAQISSDGTYSCRLAVSSASNNSVLPNLILQAITINSPAEDGFGQNIDFQTNTLNPGTLRISNQFISRWTIADDTTGQSELIVTGVQAGALNDVLYISGTGIFTLPLGLFEYADDTAAAAGTPPIPIGGLYRIGNTPQIRLT